MNTYVTKQSDSYPTFHIGEAVEFEVAKGRNIARWDYTNYDNVNKDLGASGVWAKGVIVHARELFGNSSSANMMNEEYYYVKFEIPGMIGSSYAGFPKPKNMNYTDWQWNRKGFLRKSSVPKCVCGSEKVYGLTTKLHSFWCEKYQGVRN